MLPDFSDGTVIGSYPVNNDVICKWHVKDSDAELGNEAVYTVKEDNIGKTICVTVTYGSTKTWEASAATIESFSIIATAGAGGTITPSGTVNVRVGEDQTFTMVPDSNYSISDVLVDGVSQGKINNYTFESVSGDHTISASFSYTEVLVEALAAPAVAADLLPAQSRLYPAALAVRLLQ